MRAISLSLLALAACAAEPAAKPADPSVDEATALEALNAHRTDRPTGDNKLGNVVRRKEISASLRYLQLKGGTGAPPLVVNPALTAAARALLAQGTKPQDGKPIDAGPVLKAAGYSPEKDGVVAVGLEQPSIYLAYASLYCQVIGETQKPNGTVITYAGTGLMKPTLREVGIAIGGTKGHYVMVAVLGTGAAKRYIGGTAYLDANHNGRCDPGEGKAGVKVTAGDAATLTGPAGTWTIALPKEDAVDVGFSGDGTTAKRPAAKGTANLTVDWRMPNPADAKLADKLIADAEKAAKGDPDAARKPQVALLAGTRLLALDDARQAKVDALVAPVKDDFDSTLRNLLAAMAEDPPAFKKRMDELAKPWKGAISDWFREADKVYKLRQQVNAALAAPAEQRPKQAAPLLKLLPAAIAECKDPSFMEQLETQQESLLAEMPPEAAPAKK